MDNINGGQLLPILQKYVQEVEKNWTQGGNPGPLI